MNLYQFSNALFLASGVCALAGYVVSSLPVRCVRCLRRYTPCHRERFGLLLDSGRGPTVCPTCLRSFSILMRDRTWKEPVGKREQEAAL